MIYVRVAYEEQKICSLCGKEIEKGNIYMLRFVEAKDGARLEFCCHLSCAARNPSTMQQKKIYPNEEEG